MPEYTIHGGDAGYRRLEILAQAIGPGTEAFLARHQIARGMSCLDLGCGGGAVTRHLAAKVGTTGHVLGADLDPRNIALATLTAQSEGLQQVAFEQLDAYDLKVTEAFDLIYMRFLLSHLHDPSKVLQNIRQALKPGGLVLIEDTDFAGHFTYPASDYFDMYVSLYQSLLEKRGANANIGKELVFLLRDHGFTDRTMHITHPAHISGPGKQMAEITFAGISGPLIAEGLVTDEEYQAIHAGLREHRERDDTVMSLPRIFQVSGRKDPSN